jgi:heme-degrading monooxygenase HmoA
MFTIVRKFRLARGSAEEVARRVQESFVSLLRELPGFREHYLLDGGPDVLISIRVFDSADEAFASNEIAAMDEGQRAGVREGHARGHGWQRTRRWGEGQERWVVMQAPTGQRFCVVRVQRPGFPNNANQWDWWHSSTFVLSFPPPHRRLA